MQFLTNLFGGSGGSMMGVIFALGLVLVLIVLSVWLLKFVFQATDQASRGRARRLSVVEALPVDGRRRLLIVRRDNVEHVLLTGGPQDVLVESGIPVVEKAMPHRPVPVFHTAPTPIIHPAPAAAAHPEPANQPAPNPTPEPAAAVATASPAAASAPAPSVSQSAVDRLRQFTRPTGRGPRSLRYTGLMRSSRAEVIPGYLEGAGSDSAKTTSLVEARGGGGALTRDGYKAGGN